MRRISPAAVIAVLCILAGLFLPVGVYDDDSIGWPAFPGVTALVVIAAAGLVIGEILLKRIEGGLRWAGLGIVLLAMVAAGPIIVPSAELQMGLLAPGFWLVLIGIAFFAWSVMANLATAPRGPARPFLFPVEEWRGLFHEQGSRAIRAAIGRFLWVLCVQCVSVIRGRWRDIAIPLIFGFLLVYLWQAVVVGFAVPPVLLPTPTAIAAAIAGDVAMLWGDFVQTFLKSVLAGFVIGNALGFGTALLADRYPFLQRGLLPLGNFASAVPIIGIAPIMVMWFGFGWESKSAVVVLMIFFPMLVNALAGLHAADRMSLDLMRSYGSSYGQTLMKLRLPVALPFIFNALKINSTLALIGAIVAEFFGSPTAGMGFRINIENGRMALDVVWATIAVAAVAGSAFYGILALLERAFTFWHPSYRAQN